MSKSTSTSAPTRSIQREIQLDAPPEAVWKAITDPAELPNWFPLAARGGATPGSAVVWSWGDFDWDLEVVEARPPQLLRLRDLSTERAGQGTSPILEIRLEGRGGATWLRLVHSGFSADSQWDEMFDGTSRGWKDVLAVLGHYLRRHAGARRSATMLRAPLGDTTYAEAWRRATAPDGIATLSADGASIELRLGDSERVSAQVLDLAPGHSLQALVPSWNDSLLHILMENCFGRPEAVFQLSSWSLPPARREPLLQQLSRRLAALFPGEQKRVG
ncbi:MAG: SRPBCC domain-containing protein [Planctomycetota bacterium]|nr:MAG: SRPBCC domain-containing protein [Planctomycetota bacterium]